MDAWTLELTVGELLLDVSIIGGLLLAGTYLRAVIPWFQRYLIPNSLIGGFLGLFLGAELADILPLDAARMGAYVYHLLAITFIGIGLHKPSRKHSFGAVNLGFMQVSIMLIQALIGIGVALLAAWLLVPGMSPGAGLLLPLGFAMGPGIAYSIGQSWASFGFPEAANIGLTMAAIGFLVAYIWGMLLVNREHGARLDTPGLRSGFLPDVDRPVGARLSFSGAAIEPLAVHVALVGALYYLTYLVTSAIASGMSNIGLEQDIPVLWSFHFILANVMTVFVRRVLLAGRAGDWLDDGMIHRMTGTFAEYLIAASIMAISLSVAWKFAVPILLICASGAVATYGFIRWTTTRLFNLHRFERFIGMFAQMTGTISSGLALLRVSDPEYRSPVAQELVLSSGMALAFGFPLLLAINIPFTSYNGSILGFAVLAAVLAAYLVLILFAWWAFLRRNARAE